jgi:hypothetical protein
VVGRALSRADVRHASVRGESRRTPYRTADENNDWWTRTDYAAVISHPCSMGFCRARIPIALRTVADHLAVQPRSDVHQINRPTETYTLRTAVLTQRRPWRFVRGRAQMPA